MKPILFTIGPFNVFAFGFFLALSFLFSTYIIWKYGKDELSEDLFLDGFLYTAVGMLFSARAVYIATHFNQFGTNILKYLVMREYPGLSLFGGLAGGVLVLWFFLRGRKVSFLHITDIFALAFTFSLAFAKLGEFLGGAGFGVKTTLPWGVRIIGLPGKYHPVELYEMLSFLGIFIFLSFVYRKIRKDKSKEGFTSLLFLLFLSLETLFFELFKEKSLFWSSLSFKQIFTLPVIFAVLTILLLQIKKRGKEGKPVKK